MTNTTAVHRTWFTALLLLAAFGVAYAVGVPAAHASSEPTTVEFEKSFDPAATEANGTPTWTGTITSGDGGTIEMRLVDYRANGMIEHLVLDFILTTDDGVTTARMAGTFNNQTQRTVLNGTVTGGVLAGATAHEEGLRTDADTSSFVGSLQIQSGSAD